MEHHFDKDIFSFPHEYTTILNQSAIAENLDSAFFTPHDSSGKAENTWFPSTFFTGENGI